jgi:hypothetical protein
MTDKEVLEALGSHTQLDHARQIFSSECARIEQAGMQRQPLKPIDMRRMEFEAVRKIAAVFGVKI